MKEIQAARRVPIDPMAHTAPRRRPVAAVEDAAERDVRTFKTLAAVFAMATVSLIGVIIYLLIE